MFDNDLIIIRKLERDLKSINKSLDILTDKQSIFYQEIEKQYIRIAKNLVKERNKLANKIIMFNK